MKKRVLIYIFAALIFVCGCKNEKDKPDGVLSREETIDIVVDAWIMEGAIHNVITDGTKLEAATVALYQKFFEDHHITKEQYMRSIEYYTSEDKASEHFIKECVQRLEERQEEFTVGTGPTSWPQ